MRNPCGSVFDPVASSLLSCVSYVLLLQAHTEVVLSFLLSNKEMHCPRVCRHREKSQPHQLLTGGFKVLSVIQVNAVIQETEKCYME